MDQETDLYALLGVPRDADREAIQKAYRQLARQFHPDLNPGDENAEERFKQIANAYAVLSDEQKRADYDEFGSVSLEAGFDADEARRMREQFGERFGFPGGPPHGAHEDAFHFGGIDDLLGQMFGGQARRGGPSGPFRMRGADLEAGLELEFVEAVRGTEKRLTLGRPGSDGRVRSETVTVRIPPGVDESGRLRIPGKGAEGEGGGEAGDLWVQLRVRAHPFFGREGRNLTLDLPLHVSEATLGARVEVPTLDGRATLTIPPGTQGGARLRLRGKGVPGRGGKPDGDLLVRVKIAVPRDLDDEARSAVEKLRAFEDPSLRKELFQ